MVREYARTLTAVETESCGCHANDTFTVQKMLWEVKAADLI